MYECISQFYILHQHIVVIYYYAPYTRTHIHTHIYLQKIHAHAIHSTTSDCCHLVRRLCDCCCFFIVEICFFMFVCVCVCSSCCLLPVSRFVYRLSICFEKEHIAESFSSELLSLLSAASHTAQLHMNYFLYFLLLLYCLFVCMVFISRFLACLPVHIVSLNTFIPFHHCLY